MRLAHRRRVVISFVEKELCLWEGQAGLSGELAEILRDGRGERQFLAGARVAEGKFPGVEKLAFGG